MKGLPVWGLCFRNAYPAWYLDRNGMREARNRRWQMRKRDIWLFFNINMIFEGLSGARHHNNLPRQALWTDSLKFQSHQRISEAWQASPLRTRPLVQTFPPFATKPQPNNRVWAWPWLSGHMGVRRCVLMELWAQGEYVWACWHACATWCCGVHGVQLPTAYMHRFGQMKSPLFIQCLQSVSNSNKQENNRINDANFFKYETNSAVKQLRQ